jgi:undecaprenyl-diphosphatase
MRLFRLARGSIFHSKRGMPDWFVVALLGIIEGITEFLPVSSTGHLLIAQRWLPRQTDLFDVVIQCGAVIAVLPLFPERCRQVLRCGRDASAREYILKILVAFGITGAIGFILEKKSFKLPEALAPVGWALLVGGILFLVVERWLRGRTLRAEVTWAMVVAVGFGQLIAMIFPGASRSGTTILLMLLLGANRVVATEYSFLVGIPTMLSAGGLKIFKALRHGAHGSSIHAAISTSAAGAGLQHSVNTGPENWGMVALGTLVSAVVSFLVVKWLLRFVQSHTFEGFGWYRIAAGLLILLFFLN